MAVFVDVVCLVGVSGSSFGQILESNSFAEQVLEHLFLMYAFNHDLVG